MVLSFQLLILYIVNTLSSYYNSLLLVINYKLNCYETPMTSQANKNSHEFQLKSKQSQVDESSCE